MFMWDNIWEEVMRYLVLVLAMSATGCATMMSNPSPGQVREILPEEQRVSENRGIHPWFYANLLLVPSGIGVVGVIYDVVSGGIWRYRPEVLAAAGWVPRSTTVEIGMTAAQVRAVAGRPLHVNSTTYEGGVEEQWVYRQQYVYLSNGVVRAIQNTTHRPLRY
jgi:hypothetical protein